MPLTLIHTTAHPRPIPGSCPPPAASRTALWTTRHRPRLPCFRVGPACLCRWPRRARPHVCVQVRGIAYEFTLYITLLVKRDNRRKHNSHEWFFGHNGFAENTNARYLLATDAFTLFAPSSVWYLIHYMDQHERCSVSTGQQRVMSRKVCEGGAARPPSEGVGVVRDPEPPDALLLRRRARGERPESAAWACT